MGFLRRMFGMPEGSTSPASALQPSEASPAGQSTQAEGDGYLDAQRIRALIAVVGEEPKAQWLRRQEFVWMAFECGNPQLRQRIKMSGLEGGIQTHCVVSKHMDSRTGRIDPKVLLEQVLADTWKEGSVFVQLLNTEAANEEAKEAGDAVLLQVAAVHGGAPKHVTMVTVFRSAEPRVYFINRGIKPTQ